MLTEEHREYLKTCNPDAPIDPRQVVLYNPKYLDSLIGCWIMAKFNPEKKYEFVPSDYDASIETLTTLIKGRDVAIVGFSYEIGRVQELAKIARTISIMVHHKTSVDELTTSQLPINVLIFTTRHAISSAYMWAIYNSNEGQDPIPPRFIQHVQDRTLWTFKHGQSNDFFMGLMGRGVMTMHFPTLFMLFDGLIDPELSEGIVANIVKEGGILNRFKMMEAERLVEGKRYIHFAHSESPIPVVNCPKFMVSEVGNILAKGELFSVCWYDEGNYRHYHMRSLNADAGVVDVSRIAKYYRGGGQPTAASFKVRLDHALVKFDHRDDPMDS